MKLLHVTGQEVVFAIRPAELRMLLIVLGSFPVLNRAQTLTKSGDEEQLADAQKLLDEAMSGHWNTMHRELQTWLKAPDRFRKLDRHLEWRIENERREWLLQVLNNVRVGSWLELGSPENLEAAHHEAGEDAVPHLALMEMAGMFQSALLDPSAG